MRPPSVVSRGVGRVVAAARARAARRQPRTHAAEVSRESDVKLPDWPIYSLTWSIPQPTFGGMTNVLLHRAQLFSAVGPPVDVLTFGYDFDVARARRELAEGNRLGKGSRLRNLWEEIAEASDAELDRQAGRAKRQHAREALEPPERLPSKAVSKRTTRDRIIPSASVEWASGAQQTEYYRTDESLLLVDERPSRIGGTQNRRKLTLFSRDGRALALWNRPEDLYEFWLDLVLGDDKALLICDSKFLGGLIHGYQRRNALKVQCLHSAHLRRESASPLGLVTQPKKRLLTHLEDFDAHVVLTSQQAADMDVLFGPSSSRFVVPNGVARVSLSARGRVDGRGVVVSRLTAAKQIDHAIRAVRRHNDACPDLPVHLEIYGSGDDEAKLRALTAERGMETTVVFKGHTDTPDQAYARAGFSLNTSQSEGFSLSPLESMAQGCIPISYDVRYGPATVISTGENGFLVEQGDVAGLADRIRQYVELSGEDKDRMRRAAVARAGDFSDQRLLQRWADILAQLVDQHEDLGPAAFRVSGVDVLVDASGFDVQITGRAGRRLVLPRAYVRAVQRHQPAVTRFPCHMTTAGQRTWTAAARVAWTGLSWAPEGTFDFSLEISDAGDRTALRVPAPPGYRPQQWGRQSLYPTIYSNLSLKLGPSTA